MKPSELTKSWLPIAVVTTGLFAALYGSGNYILRQAANDPQISLARQAADALRRGQAPAEVNGQTNLDLTESLEPMIITYTPDRQLSAFSGTLGKAAVVPPEGTFKAAKAKGETRFTWAPGNNLRLAAVLVYADDKSGYALAARNLSETEARLQALALSLALGWTGTLAAAYGALWLIKRGL